MFIHRTSTENQSIDRTVLRSLTLLSNDSISSVQWSTLPSKHEYLIDTKISCAAIVDEI
jgi:hypothetical protein